MEYNGMITKGKWDTFLTFPGEELLLVQRRHILVILLPVLFTSLFLSIFLFFAFFIFIRLLSSIPLFLITALLFISISLSFITKIIIDWYFHLYILTSKKILEVWYTPLASHVINDVLLDKVNCTEIDLRISGFIRELIDMGDVVITFDRPTHEEEFILKDIKHAHIVERFLEKHLMDHQSDDTHQAIWYRRRNA